MQPDIAASLIDVHFTPPEASIDGHSYAPKADI